MKILLFNDLSSLQLNLRDGLRELGHEVKLIASGDKHKKIECDIKFDLSEKSTSAKLAERAKLLPVFFRSDVVQLVTPNFLFSNVKVSIALLRLIKAVSNAKLFSLLALENPETWAFYRKGGYRLSLHEGILNDLKENKEVNIDEQDGQRNDFNAIVNALDGIIPSAYEYTLPFMHHPKYKGTIPFPINTDKFPYFPNETKNGKIKFFHGIQSRRKGFKGSQVIVEAMEQVRAIYPNDVDIVKVQDMPYKDYFDAMNSSHVVIDQVNSYSPAMNALIAMAKGKVVFSGAEKEYLDYWKYTDVPFFNVSSNIDDIKNKMIWVLENKTRIPELGHQSSAFVHNNHHYIKIAETFVHTWSN